MHEQIQVNENKCCFEKTICNTHVILELYPHKFSIPAGVIGIFH